ncbi:MAG: PAS domain-containing protein [Anaerolineaceae bacterium]|nr:PAS domain-containing protein [Anaerolineaceae bacterium]
MQIHLIPHAPPYGIIWPDNPVSVFGAVIFCTIIVLMVRSEHRRVGRHIHVNWIFISILAILGVLFNSLAGVSFERAGFLQTYAMSLWDTRHVAMLLAAIPWMLAAGLFGGVPGLVVGFISGVTRAYLFDHSILIPLETALFAMVFAWLVKQPYRTAFFRALRHPIIASVIVGIGAVNIHVMGVLLVENGSLYVRLDQVFREFPYFMMITFAELLVAGIACEGFYKMAPADLLLPEYFIPSPGERNLQSRFALNIVPWIIVLFILASLVTWHNSENRVLKSQVNRAITEGEKVDTSIQALLRSNTDALASLALDTRLFASEADTVEAALREMLNDRPLFDQLIVVDRDLKVVASHPVLDYQQGEPKGAEAEELTRTFQDGQLRLASLPALRDGRSAQISFIEAIQGDNANPVRVLIGRSDFTGNPQGQLLLASLDNAQNSGLLFELIDENGYLIFHPSAAQLMNRQYMTQPEDNGLYQTVSSDGLRQWTYYQRVPQTGWGASVVIPGWMIQKEVLQIAGTMLLLSFGILLLVCGVVWMSLGSISKSILRLTADAEKIAGGQLAVPVRPIKDSDEIGQLSHAFEKMRGALKSRMDELNRLVEVSQGVASSLAIQEAVIPILEAGLGDDASAARIIIEGITDVEQEQNTRFGTGPSSEAYAYLDDQISELTREHEQLIINNLQRGRVLSLPPEKSHPSALVAIPLQSDEEEHGTFWVAYDSPRDFSEEEIRFIKTLAGEAVLASTNARLYDSAALGRQRLEAVLAATPDPVLVIDQKAHLILMNPAARDLAGPQEGPLTGKQVREVFPQEELRKLLTAVGDDEISREIQYPDGRLFYATLSPVMLDGKQVGKACLLRDVTRFKEADGLKTEFVATVSHDLRSPLLTARGYASMLAMVGELNEQQKSYLQRILDGIDDMTHLVNNLLDPDRLKGGKTIRTQFVQIGSLVSTVIDSLREQAAQKKIMLEVNLGTHENKGIEADPVLLERALFNLVENALKYAPVNGSASLAVQADRTKVTFQVSDNGNGIAPLDLPHIFDRPPLEEGSLDSSRASWGLSIVKTIAEQHGGRVWVESQLGRGSNFYMEVPLNPGD